LLVLCKQNRCSSVLFFHYEMFWYFISTCFIFKGLFFFVVWRVLICSSLLYFDFECVVLLRCMKSLKWLFFFVLLCCTLILFMVYFWKCLLFVLLCCTLIHLLLFFKTHFTNFFNFKNSFNAFNDNLSLVMNVVCLFFVQSMVCLDLWF
jgi:hypothetical protein